MCVWSEGEGEGFGGMDKWEKQNCVVCKKIRLKPEMNDYLMNTTRH